MRKTAPKKYHDLLIPDFEVGCKRRIFDSNYLQSLNADNITLTNEKAVEILPKAVRMQSGKVIDADVLVLANGFVTNQYLGGIELIGRNGETLEKHWDSFGGPEAYNCTSLSSFPNMFFLLGPNSVTGHTSAVMAIENAVNYSLRVLEPVLKGEASVAELKRSAEEDYSNQMQAALSQRVWTGCDNWYTRNDNGKVWNAMTYPWSQAYLWWASLFPVRRDWEYRGPRTKSLIVHRFRPILAILKLAALISGGVFAWVRLYPNSPLTALILSQMGGLKGFRSQILGSLPKTKWA
ncbi:hypothetical protein N0V88_007742 [Collariella sp. IMI 366227]|nr:hypothetical protein N0V88_007742 [Collariella sp. IMI 366227]